MNQLVIGIPGPWEDEKEVIGAVVRANSDLEFCEKGKREKGKRKKGGRAEITI